MKYSNYRKALSSLTSGSDNTMPVVALLAGLAVGAVLGVLFAPERGSDVRNRITDKAKDLSDTAKEKISAAKRKFQSGIEEAADLKDEVVGQVKSKAKAAENLKDEVVDKTKSKAKDLVDEVSETADKVTRG